MHFDCFGAFFHSVCVDHVKSNFVSSFFLAEETDGSLAVTGCGLTVIDIGSVAFGRNLGNHVFAFGFDIFYAVTFFGKTDIDVTAPAI